MLLKKPITPTQNRHKTFRNERMFGIKRDTTNSKYYNLLPKKKPRNFKKMKSPLELYKDETIQKVIKRFISLYEGKTDEVRGKHLDDYSLVTKTNLNNSFEHLKFKLKTEYNIDIFNNTGKDLHLLLPLSGMSSVGYFYKAIFEKLLPEARVTFLKTYSKESEPARNDGIDLIELKKSINKHDKIFVLIDFIAREQRTKTIIENNLLKLNKDYNLMGINSQESYKGGILDLTSEIKNRFIPGNKLSVLSLRNVGSERTMQKHVDLMTTMNGKQVYEYILTAYAKKYNQGKILKMSDVEQSLNRDKFSFSHIYRTIPNSAAYKLNSYIEDYNPKLYNFIKRLDSAKAYAYYYLGNEFINEILANKK